jgi:hypothetical protein
MPCKRKQIHVVQLQVIHRGLESLEKFLRVARGVTLVCTMILSRGNLAARAQLHFRRAVAARRFDVVDAQFQRAMDARLQVGLVGARDVLRRHVLPFECW